MKMKKKVSILVFIALLTLPTIAMAGFYDQGLQPPFPVGYPADTVEGSGFLSNSFTYTGAGPITFSYNFITGEIPEYDDVSNKWVTVNDWFGVGLFDYSTGNQLTFEWGGDVLNSSFSALSPSVTGPEGDIFVMQTGVKTYTYTLPADYINSAVQFGICVFDVEDNQVASALLIDNISLTGGDFTNNPFADYFSDSLAGPTGLFEWMASGDLSGVTEPGTGSFAYISTHDGTLVPIPGAVWLLGSGLIGLVALRRKSS